MRAAPGRPSDSAAVPAIRAEIVVEDPAWGDEDALQALVDRAVAAVVAAAAPGRGGEVAVLFADDARVAELNARFRGRPSPTNVLSFPAPSGPTLGDVALARETVAAEAAASGKTTERHLTHLVVHGLLHLLGHDHEADGEAEAMEALERRVLARLGLPDPYQDGD